MLRNWIAWDGSFTRKSMRRRWEERNRSRLKRGRDRRTKWSRLSVTPRKERDCRKRNRNAWSRNSEGTWWISSPRRTNWNNWPSRNEEWNNRNIRDKLKDYGRRDYSRSGWRRRESRKSTPNRWKTTDGMRNRSKKKRRDCLRNTCLISKALCPRNWPRCRAPSTSRNVLNTVTGLIFDLNINIITQHNLQDTSKYTSFSFKRRKLFSFLVPKASGCFYRIYL